MPIDDTATEYTTDRGITLYVARATKGRRTVTLQGDDGQQIPVRFADVPRLIQALTRVLDDARKADDEPA